MTTVVFDNLQLEAPLGWTFHEFGAVILGRRNKKNGSLQISLAFRTALPPGASRDDCIQMAGRFVEPDSPPDHIVLADSAGFFGRFNRTAGDEVSTVWYRFVAGELIVGVCARDERVAERNAIVECEQIMRSVRFK